MPEFQDYPPVTGPLDDDLLLVLRDPTGVKTTQGIIASDLITAFAPRLHQVFPLLSMNHTNWSNVLIGDDGHPEAMSNRYGIGTINQELNFVLPMAAGTWEASMVVAISPASGIANFKFDGVSGATIDCYNDPLVRGIVAGPVGGIVIPRSKLVTVQIIMDNKNVASTGYQCQVSIIQLRML